MNNRVAFIDFVHGLLNINPLERWTPQQARTHPFITQQKFTGPFQPQMHLKSSTSRSPAPGVQQQQQAEALSKQRAQAAQQQQQQQQQAQAQAQAHSAATAAYAGMQMQPQAYPASPHAQQSPQSAMYGNMYAPNHQVAPPPYPANPPVNAYNQLPMLQQPPPAAAMHAHHPHGYQHNQPAPAQSQSSLYAQATTRAGRQRASTMDLSNGIPSTLQRVVSHLDPNAPIRLQPSPAYYPPPAEGQQGDVGNIGGRRRMSRGPRDARGGGGQSTNFVRQLEDRTLEEGWTGSGGGGGGGWA